MQSKKKVGGLNTSIRKEEFKESFLGWRTPLKLLREQNLKTNNNQNIKLMEEIKELLAITQRLKEKYIHLNKNFSLDGKLVGDIGEVLAAEKYGLKLLDENAEVHDAEELATGRMVQIKSSFKGNSYFPYGTDRMPEYFLSIVIDTDGNISELFNGPGQFVLDHYILKNNLKPYKNHYYTLSRGVLEELNGKVPGKDKIQEVKKA